jgi:uncharacterized surface protein with fasciclin (FAS1) repeats
MAVSLRKTLLAAVAVSGLSAVAVSNAQAASVADTLASIPQFSKIVHLIQQAGLTGSLRSSNRVTMFAPTDAAFGNVPQSVMDQLVPQASQQIPSQSKLPTLIRIHLLNGEYVPAQFAGRAVTVVDEAGTQLQLDGRQPGQLTIMTVPVGAGGPNVTGLATSRTAHVVAPPIQADNGVIYPIDNVLMQ